MEAAKAVIERQPATVESLLAAASADMAGVDDLIIARMQSPVSVIPALADHIIVAGGKRLRPLLTVVASRLAGGRDDSGIKLAAAVEFIHTATLLHDDVVDGSNLRRGKVAAHLIWGAPSSVLVGDFLFARAFELMTETGSMKALEILARASRVISEGEVLQLTRSHDIDLDRETYLRIISAKTAELFAAAAEAGAVAGGGSTAACAGLRAYGLNLGLAFQLNDDALDYDGSAAKLGKNVGDDFREGKVTLPVILAMRNADGAGRAFWDRVIGRREQSEADFETALTLIAEGGYLAATRAFAGEFADAAKAALAPLPAGALREGLEALADFAVSRQA